MKRRKVTAKVFGGLLLIGLVHLFFLPAPAMSQALPTLTNVMPPMIVIPGQSQTLTVMVSSIYENVGAVPGGTVDFFANGNDYLGSATLTASSLVGVASLSVKLPAGFYYISAQYNGDYSFEPSYSVPSVTFVVME